MSVDTKKKEKKGGRTLYALPVAFPCPFGPSWPPLVCSIVSVAFSMCHSLLVCVVVLLSAGSSWWCFRTVSAFLGHRVARSYTDATGWQW